MPPCSSSYYHSYSVWHRHVQRSCAGFLEANVWRQSGLVEALWKGAPWRQSGLVEALWKGAPWRQSVLAEHEEYGKLLYVQDLG